MKLQVIVAPLLAPALAALTWFSAPETARAQSAADNVIVEMSRAFKRGDKTRLSSLLPQAKGHPLEPWAAYWELKARLEDASPDDVRQFLTRYADTYQEDRLRNDWLLLLGQRRDWSNFVAEHGAYRMRDDREVHCYAIATDAVRGSLQQPAAAADEVRRLWHSLRDADDGCAFAAERLLAAGALKPADAWRKARLSIEAKRDRAARRAVEIVQPEALGAMGELLASPAKFVAQRSGGSRAVRQELLTLALIKMAVNDGDAAEAQLLRLGNQLSAEERNWVWGVLGKQAATRLDLAAINKFAQVTRLSDLPDDTLAWMTRANLRETSGPNARKRWASVQAAIHAMSDEAQRDPAWVYWHAMAQLALHPANSPQAHESRTLLTTLAGPRGFYEQLALEQSGLRVTVPAPPPPVTAEEREVARRNPHLARALAAIALGLRPEGVREWNYATNFINPRGVPGPMNERELLAAADLACQVQVWDRCINTSERTKEAFDVAQRFPTPFRDAVVARSQQINLDPAYVYGLIRQESRFIMDARSGVGASGLMQVMPATAKWTANKIGMTGFTADQITNRDTNIAIGTAYLKLVLDDFGGSMPLAAAAYNAGPGRPRNWRNGPVMDAAIWAENVPFLETREYVKKVLANTTLYAAVLTGQPQSLRERLGQVGPAGSGAAVNRELP